MHDYDKFSTSCIFYFGGVTMMIWLFVAFTYILHTILYNIFRWPVLCNVTWAL